MNAEGASRQRGRPGQPHAEVASLSSGSALEHAHLVKPWNVEIEQIAPNSARGSVAAVSTPSVLIYEEHWPWQARVRGSNPPGYIVVGAHLGWRRSPLTWCGSALGPQTLATAAPSSEIEFTVPEASHHAVALVTPQFLEQGLGRQAVDSILAGWELKTSRRRGVELGLHIVRAVRRYHRRPEDLTRPLEAWSIESDLMDALIQCTQTLASPLEPTDRPRRARALAAALEHADHRQGRVTARELALSAGVSQRTLEHAFRERFGVTPGVFLRLKRLNGAHRELLASEPGATTVSKIASNWGFTHQGRFSALHRQVFEELPFRTLRRSRPLSLHSLGDTFTLRAG